MIFATLLFLSFHRVYNCFPNSVSKNLRFQGKVPNSSKSLVPVFNRFNSKRTIIDIRSSLPVFKFPNMMNPTQILRPSHPVAYSFLNPFPRIPFKMCTHSCYRPTLRQDFPSRVLRMVCKLSPFLLFSF